MSPTMRVDQVTAIDKSGQKLEGVGRSAGHAAPL